MSHKSVLADLSVIPIGTGSTSIGQYITRSIDSLKDIEGIRYQVTPVSTHLEAESVEKIFSATKAVMNALFEMGVQRIVTRLEIDERHDKIAGLEKMPESQKEINTMIR